MHLQRIRGGILLVREIGRWIWAISISLNYSEANGMGGELRAQCEQFNIASISHPCSKVSSEAHNKLCNGSDSKPFNGDNAPLDPVPITDAACRCRLSIRASTISAFVYTD